MWITCEKHAGIRSLICEDGTVSKAGSIGTRHSLDTTNLQNTQPGRAGEAPTERISRASPSSESLGVLRLVEVGAEIAKMDLRECAKC